MLVYEHRNRYNVLSEETYVNPEHVACVTRRITGPNIYRYEATTIDGKLLIIDEEGYYKLVNWMGEHE